MLFIMSLCLVLVCVGNRENRKQTDLQGKQEGRIHWPFSALKSHARV